jgi:DNA primase
MLTILNFIPHVKRETQSEYSSICPWCGGKDRFRIFINKGHGGRFWCRQCNIRGDGIDFLRKQDGLSFKSACAVLGLDYRHLLENSPSEKNRFPFVPKKSKDAYPSAVRHFRRNFPNIVTASFNKTWFLMATKFVKESMHSHNLSTFPEWQKALKLRHLTEETAITYNIGWNSSAIYLDASEWSLSGNRLKLPKGLVIPTYHDGQVVKILIKTFNPNEPYWQVKGSSEIKLCLYGQNLNLPIMIVESDLDALLLYQEVGDLVGVVSLAGLNKPFDEATYKFLSSPARRVILSLDRDKAGENHYPILLKLFPNAKILRVAFGSKDHCEMLNHKVLLRDWLTNGLKELSFSNGQRYANDTF